MASLRQKENEKKKIYELYKEKYHTHYEYCEKVKQKKDKLDRIKRKNENLKILICQIMKKNNIFKENF